MGSVVDDCIIASNSDAGLVVDTRCAVTDCLIRDNGGNGINLFGVENDISRNRCLGNGGIGIAVNSDASGVIRDNYVVDNAFEGIRAFSPGSIILRNVATGNSGSNDLISPGNDVGPLGPASAATNPLANVDSRVGTD
jgi:hypothetical protein